VGEGAPGNCGGIAVVAVKISFGFKSALEGGKVQERRRRVADKGKEHLHKKEVGKDDQRAGSWVILNLYGRG